MQKTKLAVNRIISSVWLIEYNQISESECELIKYSRDDSRIEQEDSLPSAKLKEDDERNVIGIELCDNKHYPRNVIKTLKVINPKHIFDYK